MIDEKYKVLFFIKKGSYAETYRVSNLNNETFFLKLFDHQRLHPTQYDSEGKIKEIVFLKHLKHYSIVNQKDSNAWTHKDKDYSYLVLEYISGETLAEYMSRKSEIGLYEIKQIIVNLLNGLKYLHANAKPVIHNDINHHNVMIDLNADQSSIKLIDFGYARYFHNSTKVYYRDGLNPFYLAPECFKNLFSPQSDLFSVGVLIYHLVFRLPPWFFDLSNHNNDSREIEEALSNSRTKPLKFPQLNSDFHDYEIYCNLIKVIEKALQTNLNDRYKSAQEMIDALQSPEKQDKVTPISQSKANVVFQRTENPAKGNGFNQIAGMDALKECLYLDVIQALEEKELYDQYGLTIPNGMLLYGPPGCGKSFFAEKLAEEVGYNYVEVKPSALASIYVHGVQEKIGNLFDEARKEAPTILNFDEFDALVPSRDSNTSNHQMGEVNEFLAQLNNCGKDNVFVIASTNQPELIDAAVLRAGRIDKMFYVPPPDFLARKEMFKLFLKNRPVDDNINFALLSKKTNNYVSVDIKQLVNQAARIALKEKCLISETILLSTIVTCKPTVGIDVIKKYELMRQRFESKAHSVNKNRPIGFRQSDEKNE
ncbi:AAA family ATPase [Marinilabiliaceae bacterium ANBcel2]|nr:AAA family ATPase [Marinilabiliaceae bacterium ANBcel2]